MTDSSSSAPTVINEYGGNFFQRENKIDKHYRNSHRCDVIYILFIDFSCNDYAIDVVFQQKTRNRFFFIIIFVDRCKQYIIILFTGCKFSSEKNLRIERFRLLEMIFSENEADISA